MNLLIGTYSEPILFGTGELFCGKGKGVYFCKFDGENIRQIHVLETGNPSFLAVDEEKKKLYAVNEMKEFQGNYGGGITEVDYNESGEMRVRAAYCTEGTDPCHVAVSPDGQIVATANFADGTVSVFELNSKGELTSEKQIFRHQGSSVHPVRQRGPHAHSVIFSGNGMLLVPDLGTDQLVCYDCSTDRVKEDSDGTITVEPGSGPRFGEFTPDGRNFYLINELASSVTHFSWDGVRLHMGKTVRTLPDDFNGENICSDLHITPDGRFLYASNRGHDSITAYRIEGDGNLTKLACVPCGGKTPRNFAIAPDGKYLLVGNQDSDSIVVYRIEKDGMLKFIKKNEFPTPVCIRFLKGEK